MKTFRTPYFNYSHIKTQDYSQLGHQDQMHSYYEFLYFLGGEAQVLINGQTYQLKKRDLLLFHTGVHHCIIPNKSLEYERICIHFQKQSLRGPYQKILNALKPICHIHKYSSIDNIFNSFIEAEYTSHYSEEDIIDLISQNLGVIITHLKYLQDEKNIVPIAANEFINDVLDYIDKNITQPINIETISKTFFKSASSISHKFSYVMKMPIQQYITNKKIIYAQTLIQQGYPPMAVAHQLSFKDYSTFFKAYKRVLGVSPTKEPQLIKTQSLL